jgi:hypothetical protein
LNSHSPHASANLGQAEQKTIAPAKNTVIDTRRIEPLPALAAFGRKQIDSTGSSMPVRGVDPGCDS